MGAAYALAGRGADAVPLLMQAMAQSTATETVIFQALCGLSLGEAQVVAGRLEEAHALAEGLLAYTRERQERGYQAYGGSSAAPRPEQQGFLGRRRTVKVDEGPLMDAACQNGKISTDTLNVEFGAGRICQDVGGWSVSFILTCQPPVRLPYLLS